MDNPASYSPTFDATPVVADALHAADQASRSTSSDADTAIDARALRASLAAYPTGVVLLAALVDGRPVGLLANSFTSVSLDPPLVSVSVGRNSPTLGQLLRAPRLGISVLAEHHHDVFAQLARRSDVRFEGVDLTVFNDGTVLLPKAASSLAVRLDRSVEAGDHLLLLLRVLDHSGPAAASPLVFHGSAVRRLAV